MLELCTQTQSKQMGEYIKLDNELVQTNHFISISNHIGYYQTISQIYLNARFKIDMSNM